MRFSLRKVLILMVLSLAVSSPAVMAKDSPTTKSKVSSAADGKSQYKRTTVNINKANAAALSAYLVGVGPVKAKAIVAYRNKNGKFSNVKDILKVDGIGEGVFGGLKKNISTSRGETSAPKGYKMGSATAKKKSSSAKKKLSSAKKKSTTAKKSTSSTTKSKSASSKAKAKSSTKKATSKLKDKTKAKKKTTKKKTVKKTKSSKAKKKKVKK